METVCVILIPGGLWRGTIQDKNPLGIYLRAETLLGKVTLFLPWRIIWQIRPAEEP